MPERGLPAWSLLVAPMERSCSLSAAMVMGWSQWPMTHSSGLVFPGTSGVVLTGSGTSLNLQVEGMYLCINPQ